MAYILDVLTGRIPVDLTPYQRSIFDHLMEKWDVGERRDEMLAGFRDLVSSEDPDLRSAAVEFFVEKRQNDDGLLVKAMATYPDLYDIPRRWYGGDADRRPLASLILTHACRLGKDSEDLRSLVRDRAEAGSMDTSVLQYLVRFDPEWLVGNIGQLVGASADTLRDLFYALKMFGKLPDPFVQAIGGVDRESLLEAVQAVLPRDLPRIRWRMAKSSPAKAPDTLSSPVWSDRLDAVRTLAGDPASVETLTRLHMNPTEGCTDLDVPDLDESISDGKRECRAVRRMRREIISALVSTGASEEGLYELLTFSGQSYPSPPGEVTSLALRKLGAQVVYDFAKRMMIGSLPDREHVGSGVAASGLYFDLSMAAIGFLSKEPPELPEFLAMFREGDLPLLESVSRGPGRPGKLMKDLLKVMKKY